jgi:hypothetical protein
VPLKQHRKCRQGSSPDSRRRGPHRPVGYWPEPATRQFKTGQLYHTPKFWEDELAQQEKAPDFLDRFADGLERTSERMKAIDSSPKYQRDKRLARLRAKWIFLCGFIALPIAILAVWICEWFDWSKQIYLTAIPMIALGGVQVFGTTLANRAIKRSGLSE